VALPKPVLRGLLVLGLAGALGGGALTVAFARGATLGLDPEVRTAIHSGASPGLTMLMRGITQFGSWDWLTTVTLCFLVLFGISGAVIRARLLLIAVIGALVLENGLKLLVRRARPDPYFGTALPVSYSFPSGHALDSSVIYFALATLLTPYFPRPAERAILFGITAVLVLLIGISRVYLGVHWPSDVVGGWAVGAAWLAVWATMATRMQGMALSREGTHG
jgi:undecaprenyl-diphosphatase